jgi:hypothetical protein
VHEPTIVLQYFILEMNPQETRYHSAAWLCSLLYLTFDIGLHYILYFHERNLENRKNSMLVWIMNSVDMDGKNNVNSIGTFSDSINTHNILVTNIETNNVYCKLCREYNSILELEMTTPLSYNCNLLIG